jgi:acyl-CoA synthetase (NDP forming)
VTKGKGRTSNTREQAVAIEELEPFPLVNTVRKQITHKTTVGGDLMLNAGNAISWDTWKKSARTEQINMKRLKLLINNRRNNYLWPPVL